MFKNQAVVVYYPDQQKNGKIEFKNIIYYCLTNNMDNKTSLEKYLETLSEKEMKSYLIAKEHLGTSFELEKSVGYLRWKEKIEKEPV